MSTRIWFTPCSALLAALGTLLSLNAAATTFPLPPAGVDVIGEVKIEYAKYEDTFVEIGRRNNMGFDEMVMANPGLSAWLPGDGTPVTIPARYILPRAPREGIVLNVPEMRLYYYPKGQNVVITHPVGIGREDWRTPLGKTTVVTKVKDPAWRPPASIRAEHAAEGDILPEVVPPGPDNPLGQFAMRLGIPGYLIHGTDKPNGIGMRVTHGCMRLYPEDIASLFSQVPVGTPVYLVNQPVKVGWNGEAYEVEIHPPLEEDAPKFPDLAATARQLIGGTPDIGAVDPEVLSTAVEQASGLPVVIASGHHNNHQANDNYSNETVAPAFNTGAPTQPQFSPMPTQQPRQPQPF